MGQIIVDGGQGVAADVVGLLDAALFRDGDQPALEVHRRQIEVADGGAAHSRAQQSIADRPVAVRPIAFAPRPFAGAVGAAITRPAADIDQQIGGIEQLPLLGRGERPLQGQHRRRGEGWRDWPAAIPAATAAGGAPRQRRS